MVLLPASVLVTVGVATKVTGTAAVVGIIEDAGKTLMCKIKYNCFTSSDGRFWHISYSITKLHKSLLVLYILNYKAFACYMCPNF